ncbi:MAG: polysaccharide deacetylase family protein [Lachnospiraceae bacterium]|nr:polysaccharide deacetylase family protein [Lachnospiraceae bacterium]
MKNKIKILIASVIIAVVVILIGIFVGTTELKESADGEQNTTEDSSSGESTTAETESGKETTAEDVTSESESTLDNETSTQETETQTEAQTTLSGDFVEQNPVSGTIDPGKPMVALTFDDGPAGSKTGRLLDALEQYGAHATFFIVGNRIPGDEENIKRAAALGCEVGNHSYSHAKLTSLDDASVANEIHSVAETIKSLTGQNTVICRPPYGAVDERVQAVVDAPVILWSIDTRDWETRNAAQTIANIQQNVQDGDIILMHDIHAESVDAAVQIIPWLQQQGYQLVTVSELAYYKRGGLSKNERYGSIR